MEYVEGYEDHLAREVRIVCSATTIPASPNTICPGAVKCLNDPCGGCNAAHFDPAAAVISTCEVTSFQGMRVSDDGDGGDDDEDDSAFWVYSFDAIAATAVTRMVVLNDRCGRHIDAIFRTEVGHTVDRRN